ncbi:hypothetical protein PROFUN_13985 [Planoprotostelium fungivorum]|uniref:RED-like N-terminal domain-containing protein n=1 Tax=Planoprotostelium fungivorum TaxID=1890364 RepID=A0A2P6N2L2_9EUKA|nr:hypothetical protein PROFUN_13985 [Planoprotostelium fungivorum]
MAEKKNSFFREMLMTPRRETEDTPRRALGGGGAGGRLGMAAPSTPSNKKQPKVLKRHLKPGEKRVAEEIVPGYRDRARERREGLFADRTLLEVEMFDATRDKNADADEDKMLMANVQTTHQILPGNDDYVSSSDEEQEEKKVEEKERPPEFISGFGRKIFSLLFQPQPNRPTEQFLPARTSFIFELKGTNDVPSILKRSKDDCPKQLPSMLLDVEGDISRKLAEIMNVIRTKDDGSLQKHKKRLKQEQEEENKKKMREVARNAIAEKKVTDTKVVTAAPATMEPEEDEDIFPDAGTDYVPTIPEEKKSAPAVERSPEKKAYFDKPLTKEDYKNDVQPELNALSQQIQEAARAQKRKEREQASSMDDYTECYPSTYEHYSLDPNDPNYVKNDVGKQKGRQKKKAGQKVQSDKQLDSQMNKIDSIISERKTNKNSAPSAEDLSKKARIK